MQKNPILTVRENAGLTRREFSQRAGLTYQTTMTLEKGYNHTLRPETAQRIAEVAKCDPAKLQEDFKRWKQELREEEPYTGEWADSLGFQYHYDILPGSVISRFIVRMHTYIHQKTYWRNGVVLISEDWNNRALIKADPEDKKIFISVTSEPATRQMLLAIIRADFRKIHATIPKLVVKEKVPIPGHPQVVVDYEHLLTLEKMGEETFIPEGLHEKVNVRELLHGIPPHPGPHPKREREIKDKYFIN